MSLRDKAVKAAGWSALQNFGSQGISFVVVLILAYLLGPSAMGLMALASVFIAFIQVFLDQGITSALIQREDLEPEHLDSAFWSNLVLGVGLMLLSWGLSDWVAARFNEPALADILRALAPIFLIGALSTVQQALLTREFAFKSLALRSLVGTAGGGVVGVGMALANFGVWSLVGQQLVEQLLNLSVLWWASPWRPRWRFSWGHLRPLWNFGLPVMAFNFSNFFNRRIDDLLIGYFLGTVALGYYSVAYRIIRVLVLLLTNTTLQVGLPTFSRLQQQPELIRSAFYTVNQWTSLISFPLFMGVGVFAPELIMLCFGPSWTPSISVMQVLSIVGVLQSILFFNSTVLMAMGKPSWRLGINVLQAVVGTLCFYLAVPWGITVMAATYVFSSYMLAPLYLWLVHRLIKLDFLFYLKQYLSPFVSTLIMAAALLSFKLLLAPFLSLFWILMVGSILGTLVYLGGIYFLEPLLFKKFSDVALGIRLFKPQRISGNQP